MSGSLKSRPPFGSTAELYRALKRSSELNLRLIKLNQQGVHVSMADRAAGLMWQLTVSDRHHSVTGPPLIPAFWNLLTVSLLNFLQKRFRHYIRLTLAHYLPPSASHTHMNTRTPFRGILPQIILKAGSHTRTHLNYTVDVISGRNYIFKAHYSVNVYSVYLHS